MRSRRVYPGMDLTMKHTVTLVKDNLVLELQITRCCLFVCLVFNGTSTQDRSICANCGRVKLIEDNLDFKTTNIFETDTTKALLETK